MTYLAQVIILVVCHGGHYTANIKNPNGKWYSFNDTAVNEIPGNK